MALLDGVVAAVWPCTGPTNGFRPPIGSIMPALVNKPHLTRSRRLIWPWDNALVISARFCRAFSASRIRLLSECSDNQILSSRSFRDMLVLLFRESVVVRLRFTRRSLAGRLKNLFRQITIEHAIPRLRMLVIDLGCGVTLAVRMEAREGTSTG